MDPDFWRDRWTTQQIGWHEQAPNASLQAHIGVLGLASGKRVLVPLSGKTTDLMLLSKTGAEVVGSELVETAAQAFFTEHGLAATRTVEGAFVRVASGPISILVGDFFALTPREVGPIDAVYDRAALVALPQDMRTRYAERLRILAPGAAMLAVTFVHDGPGDAPPFSVDLGELARLYRAASVAPLSERDAFGPDSGLARRGATYARELAHHVTLEA